MDIAQYAQRYQMHPGQCDQQMRDTLRRVQEMPTRYQEFRRENQQHVAVASTLLKPLDAKHGDVVCMEQFVRAPDMNALQITLGVKLHSGTSRSRVGRSNPCWKEVNHRDL